jgi:hypothetical protein
MLPEFIVICAIELLPMVHDHEVQMIQTQSQSIKNTT